MKKIILIVFSLLLLLSCNDEKKESKIKIGIVAPLTGEGASYGEAMQRGFNLIFDESNKFNLIYEDSKLQPSQGVNAIQKLISTDKVKVVYGAAASSVTLAMAPIAEKNKVILFSSISSTDDLINAGDYIFRNVPSNKVQGITAAKFLINDLKIKNIAILGENDDYGINLSQSFKKKVLELGANIVAEENYSSSDNDFRTQLNKIKEKNAEAIFVPGNYEETILIIKQMKELGMNIPTIGGDGSYSDLLIKNLKDKAEGFYCTVMGLDENSDFFVKFKKIFIKKYNKKPNVYDAYAYEAGNILLEAINNVGYDADKIKNYLYNTTFNSLTGKLKFDKNGEVNRDYNVVVVKNGNFINFK